MQKKVKFPKIKESEYAVLVANKDTGVILDIDFDIYISDNQIVYRIFSNIESVNQFIKDISEHREDIEIIVYDNNQNVVILYSPNKY